MEKDQEFEKEQGEAYGGGCWKEEREGRNNLTIL